MCKVPILLAVSIAAVSAFSVNIKPMTDIEPDGVQIKRTENDSDVDDFQLTEEEKPIGKNALFRVRRQSIPGSYSAIDPSSSQVQQIATFAVNVLSQSSSSGPLTLVSITSAESQVVSGTNYRLTLVMSGSGGLQTCTVVVYDQPWNSTRTVISNSCVPQAPVPVAISSTQAPIPVPLPISNTQAPDPVPIAISNTQPPVPVFIGVTQAPAPVDTATSNTQAAVPVAISSTQAPIPVPLPISSTQAPIPVPIAISSTQAPTILGGYSAIDPNNPQVQQITTFAANFLSQSSNSGQLTLVSVTSAESQVVSGTNYRLTLVMSGSGGLQTCNVVVYDQPWNSDGPTRTVTSYNCIPQAPVQVSISSTQAPVPVPITISNTQPPIPVPLPISSPQVPDPVPIAISNTQPPVPVFIGVTQAPAPVDTATSNTQSAVPVAISSTQAPIPVPLPISSTQAPVPVSLGGSNTQILAPLPLASGNTQVQAPIGGYNAVDPNNPQVQQMAGFAICNLGQSATNVQLTLVNVTSAETQVVDGTNYKMTLDIACAKGLQTCYVVVFDQPLTFTRKLVSATCGPHVTKPSVCAGCYAPIDPNQPNVFEVAQFATLSIGTIENTCPLTLVKVLTAASQVVSGLNYSLDFEVSAANGLFTCNAVVFDQPWTKTRKLTNYKCHPQAPVGRR